MQITITPEGRYWVVTIQGQPTRKFGTKEAAWSFVSGISSADLVQIKIYDTKGSVSAEATLNAAIN